MVIQLPDPCSSEDGKGIHEDQTFVCDPSKLYSGVLSLWDLLKNKVAIKTCY